MIQSPMKYNHMLKDISIGLEGNFYVIYRKSTSSKNIPKQKDGIISKH